MISWLVCKVKSLSKAPWYRSLPWDSSPIPNLYIAKCSPHYRTRLKRIRKVDVKSPLVLYKELLWWGRLGGSAVKRPTLDLGLAHDLLGHEMELYVRLHTQWGESAWDSHARPLPHSCMHAQSLSLFPWNK